MPIFNLELSRNYECILNEKDILALFPTLKGLTFHSLFVSIYKNNPQDLSRASAAIPGLSSLPPEHDRFDIYHRKKADSILFISYTAEQSLLEIPWITANTVIDYVLISAIIHTLQLFSEHNPVAKRSYFYTNGQLTNFSMGWNVSELNGLPLKIDDSNISSLLELFPRIMLIHALEETTAGRVLTIAQGFFFYSVFHSESSLYFMSLMISFEALFKKSETEPINKACSRISKILSDKRSDRNNFHSMFVKNCKIRNDVAHGRGSRISPEHCREIKELIREALLRIIASISAKYIDIDDYYNSLDDYIEERYMSLPI